MNPTTYPPPRPAAQGVSAAPVAPAELSRVVVRLPSLVEPVVDVLAQAGRPRTEQRMFTRVYGLRDTRVIDQEHGEDFEDLLLDAAADAVGTGGGERIDVVLYGHTLLAQTMAYRPGFAHRLRARLDLPGVPVYGVSQVACTSVLRCVELAGLALAGPAAEGRSGTALVLGGDQGSVSDTARLLPGVTAGGDGAAAVLVRRGPATADAAGADPNSPADGGRYVCLGRAYGKDTRFHRNLNLYPEEALQYGRASAQGLIDTVHAAVADAGLTLDDIDWIMPNLTNAMFWRGFSTSTGFPLARIHLALLPELGHLFGIDGLMALEHADRNGLLRPGDRCVLTAVGQGAYFHALVLEVKEPK